jgi:alpha-beta hydrolase superfamily lysophospholipase
MRRPKSSWQGWLRQGLILISLGFLLLNILAWQQAWTMTHYADTGAPPPTIEALNLRAKIRAALFGVSIARPQNVHTPRDVGLEYSVCQVEIADGGALETWIVEHPSPHGIVVLFPGYASSKDSLLTPAVALHKLGYATMLVDFRGVGGSTGNDTTLGAREADDVATAYAAAEQIWPSQPVIVYGVSMGSAAILHAIATKDIQPTAVILESPFDRLLGTVASRFHAFGVPATPAAQLLVFWGGVQHGHNGFALNPADDARSVQCPTLVLHGERDPRATTAQATAVFEQLPGKREFVDFPNAGHELLIATSPTR